MSSLNSEDEGQKQSPQDKKRGLSKTAYPSKDMGWKEAFNTYLGKGTRKRGGRSIEAQHRFTSSLHCATPCTAVCSFFGTTVSWGKMVPSKSENYLVPALSPNQKQGHGAMRLYH